MKRLIAIVAVVGLFLSVSTQVTAKELPDKHKFTAVYDVSVVKDVKDFAQISEVVFVVSNQFAVVEFNVVEFLGGEAERYPDPGDDAKADNRFINGLTNLNRQKKIPQSAV